MKDQTGISSPTTELLITFPKWVGSGLLPMLSIQSLPQLQPQRISFSLAQLSETSSMRSVFFTGHGKIESVSFSVEFLRLVQLYRGSWSRLSIEGRGC